MLLFLNGFYYVSFGQDKSLKKLYAGKELNLYEALTIRSFNFLYYTIGWARCREVAEQFWLMQWSKVDSVISKQDFIKAHFIAAQIKNDAETPVTVDADNFDLYKTDGNFLWNGHLRYGGRQSLYALAYHNATLCQEPNCEPELKTTANIHFSYDDDLFAFPFSLINPRLYNQMIAQGYFKNVVITYFLS